VTSNVWGSKGHGLNHLVSIVKEQNKDPPWNLTHPIKNGSFNWMIRIFPNLDYSEIRKWLAIEKTGLILGFQAGKPIL